VSITGPLRQLRYPPEFRIYVPDWAPAKRLKFEDVIERLSAPPPAPPASHEEDYARIVVNLANRLWTFRRQLMPQEMTQPPEEVRRLHRAFERVWNALADAGVNIMDHTNDPFDAGISLVVLAFQPTPGINRETVIETLKPSVYFKNHPLQRGEVIVGTPEMRETPISPTEEPEQPVIEPAVDQLPVEDMPTASLDENTPHSPTMKEGETPDA
jgi:hypothetical protein